LIEGEFCSNEFNEFCGDHGIKRLPTVPKSPQQNKMVKKKNKNILNMTRNMFKIKKMSNKFWDEAIDYVFYLSNRCLMKGLNNLTL
jgi:hypothetical protein